MNRWREGEWQEEGPFPASRCARVVVSVSFSCEKVWAPVRKCRWGNTAESPLPSPSVPRLSATNLLQCEVSELLGLQGALRPGVRIMAGVGQADASTSGQVTPGKSALPRSPWMWQNPGKVVSYRVFSNHPSVSAQFFSKCISSLCLLETICCLYIKTLEKEMATHSSTLVWKIPWTEEPGWLQSTGLQRVRHNWVTFTFSISLCRDLQKFLIITI